MPKKSQHAPDKKHCLRLTSDEYIEIQRRRGKEPMGKDEVVKVKGVHVGADEDRAAANESYWKDQYHRLKKDYNILVPGVAAVDRLVENVLDMAPLSYDPAPKNYPKLSPKAKHATPESAMLLLSDTHVGKIIRPEQTLGFSKYNFDVFLSRLKYLEDRITSILLNHTTAPINELVVAILGDMLDGALSHGSEVGQANTLFSQFFGAGHALAQFLRNLATLVPVVRPYTCVGNHTRWQNQRKMPTENRYSNLDQFLYAYVEALTRDIPNIHWNLNEQPYAVFDVEGFTFLAAHGDHWKGGDKAMGVPLHAMARQVNSTTQLFHKHGSPVPQYYVSGHLHREIKLPTGLGDLTVNGGFPGLDGYALDGAFNPVDPTQKFFKVHPKFGKVAEYTIQLKFATEHDTPPYALPPVFACQ
jgi:hypothetical protein